MNCTDFRHQLRHWQSAPDASQALDRALVLHLRGCASCAREHGDTIVDGFLRRQPAPVLPNGFADAVIVAAVRGGDRRWQKWHGAIAASAAAIVLALGVIATGPLSGPGEGQLPITTASQELQMVQLLIDTVVARNDATITIELTENLELDGFPEQRVIAWKADLLAGKNLLALPVRYKHPGEGLLEVSLEHGDELREIQIHVRPDGGASSLELRPVQV
jgi:hypothetical protein